ncbi:MAG: hypothetical protein NTZ74_02830 [Chloroflexi bacterium]|nr:hypothetical protein [Chloroflexota bacterium]
MITWFPLLFLGVYLSIQTSPFAALAWELKWWGGADAVSAITVCLIWPSEIFIFAFLATHLIVVLGLGLVSAIREKKISLHRLLGIPILLASVIFLKIGLVFLNQIL